jgi:peroxiredoxin
VSYRTEAPPPESDGYRRLVVGDPAPWFEQATSTSPRFRLDLVAGRYVVLCFFMGSEDGAGKRALELVAQNRELFNDEKLSFLGVTVNWRDQYEGRTAESLPGLRFLWDFDLKVSSLYGAVPADASPGIINVRRSWFILDPMLRIVAAIRFEKDGAERPRVLDVLRNLPPTNVAAGVELPPPVLYLPHVFEPDLCRHLVAAFETDPGSTVPQTGARGRFEQVVRNPELIAEVAGSIQRRIAPEVAKAFLFQATRTSSPVVACYGPQSGLSARRGDASHARPGFALSVSLSDDYGGGELSFPEYGRRRFCPPLGTAVLSSSSLLYRVSPVSRGRRHVCHCILYDGRPEVLLTESGRPASDDRVTPPVVVDDQVTPPPAPAHADGRPPEWAPQRSWQLLPRRISPQQG